MVRAGIPSEAMAKLHTCKYKPARRVEMKKTFSFGKDNECGILIILHTDNLSKRIVKT